MKKIEFSNEELLKMEDKKLLNYDFGNYYFMLGYEVDKLEYLKKGQRIKTCLDYWEWQKYEKNKLLDLQKVTRCFDNRFCSNCRRLSLAKAIRELSPHFGRLTRDGYSPMLLTLTLPNCHGVDLEGTINKLNKSFYTLFQSFNRDGKKAFALRSYKMIAAYKVLEITYNAKRHTYHPHLHCIIFIDEYSSDFFEKTEKGYWSKKRKSFNLHSLADFEIMKLWTMINKGVRLTQDNYKNYSTELRDLYLCDIKEMDEKGIYEVMKYTFKDTDIKNYLVFKTIYIAIKSKRIRQGYGELYNLKCENIEDGDVQSLEEYLEIKENPERLVTREINQLYTVYSDYKKISRFNAGLNDILSNLD